MQWRHRLMWVTVLTVALASLGGAALAQPPAEGPLVVVTKIDHEITPVIANQLCEGVDRAESRQAEAYVVELDTPGGLDSSMRDIVSCFLEAPVPVVVHVAPQGSRAASAGAIITLASHVAAMAPGTTIGAATPVGLDGTDLSDKVINDAVALAESIAEVRQRPLDFARDIVREGDAIPASEAVEIGAVELASADLDELLADLDGTAVQLADGTSVQLETAGARVERYDLNTFRQILQWLANPNLTFLLLSIGSLGIIYELANPGIGAAGAIGVIAIVTALFSLSVLPVDAVGVIFLVLALALFVGELFAPGVGVMAATGTASLVASALFLFDRGVGARVDPEVWLPVTAVAGLAVVGAGRLVLRSRRRPPRSPLMGALIRTDDIALDREQAFVDGAWWSIEPRDRPIGPADDVRVVEVRDLTLIVAPVGIAPSVTDSKETTS